MEKDVHFCSKSRRWVVNMAFAHHKKQNTLRPSKRANFLDYGGSRTDVSALRLRNCLHLMMSTIDSRC